MNKLRKSAVVLTSIVFISGCATTRFIGNPAPPQELKISEKDETLEVVLNSLIIRNGLGSWVKDALWDEYALTVRNLSDKPLTVEKIRLIDPRGVYIDSGVDPLELESATKALAEVYKDAGIAVIVGAGATVIALAAPLMFSPAVLLAAPLYLGYELNKTFVATADREKIEKEFARRNLSTVTLAGNATMTGSAFFPIVPSPQALVIDYRMKSEMKTLEIPLEKLAGFHVAPKESPKQTPRKEGEKNNE